MDTVYNLFRKAHENKTYTLLYVHTNYYLARSLDDHILSVFTKIMQNLHIKHSDF